MPTVSDDQRTHPGHRSVRLKGYDYSTPGLYFVTVCAEGRKSIFGRIDNATVGLSRLGQIVHETWLALPQHCSSVNLHVFVVMPNHIHGILQIAGRLPTKPTLQDIESDRPRVDSHSLGAIVRSFKSAVTSRARLELPLSTEIWQRTYFERVIRDGEEFSNATRYITENPLRWQWDKENPHRANSPHLAEMGRSMLRPYEELPLK